ncbi:MAG: leucine-rich repeat domain-containing protein [Butyricimonas faecihominis]
MKQVVSFILLFVFSICYGNDPLVAQTRKERQKGKEKKIVREQAVDLLLKEQQVAAERAALKELYWVLGGEDWRAKENWLSDRPVEEWYGVKRNYDNGKLSIYLGANGLKGVLPGAIFRLKTLEVLNLCNNEITGSIPTDIGECTALRQLSLNGNRLMGEIPVGIGKLENLVTLDLSRNQLSEEIPEEIGGLKQLKYLRMGTNRLTGDIPAAIGNLSL